MCSKHIQGFVKGNMGCVGWGQRLDYSENILIFSSTKGHISSLPTVSAMK
jgi:hypothetical protein